MIKVARLFFCGCLLASSISVSMAAPAIETVWVGQPGNPADATGFGAVAYEYGIGKYEITVEQYASFLNAVAATDPYSLYNPSMADDPHIAGIVRSGTDGSYQYAVVGSGKRPVSYVNWFDAARFCNWLQNGAEPNSDTEAGAYPLAGAMKGVVKKNPDARWWIPTEDEWYKAAFYHPESSGGAAYYSLYATGANEPPGSLPGDQPNQANYDAGGLTLPGAAGLQPDRNYLTEAGAFSGSPSGSGTFDQTGNVWEFVEGTGKRRRSVRGGGWINTLEYLPSTFVHGFFVTTAELPEVGIRVATKIRPSK